MPHYDYECQSCGYVFEVFQKMNDEPVKKCPQCGGKVKKLIGAGCGLIFKGSGFYITDYKRNNQNKDSSSKTSASQAQSSQKKNSPSSSSEKTSKNNNAK